MLTIAGIIVLGDLSTHLQTDVGPFTDNDMVKDGDVEEPARLGQQTDDADVVRA